MTTLAELRQANLKEQQPVPVVPETVPPAPPVVAEETVSPIELSALAPSRKPKAPPNSSKKAAKCWNGFTMELRKSRNTLWEPR